MDVKPNFLEEIIDNIVRYFTLDEMTMFWILAGLYIFVILLAFALTHLFFAVRGGSKTPYADQLGYRSHIISFMIHALVTAFYPIVYILSCNYDIVYFFVPYLVLFIIDIVVITSLMTRKSPVAR